MPPRSAKVVRLTLKPPETRLQRHQAPSARVQPKLRYQWELFHLLIQELVPLFSKHWQEIAVNKKAIKLDPNFVLYCQYEHAGVLHVLTVRAESKLVGYAFCMVGPHLHYASTTFCQIDMFWLDPVYRIGWNGIRLFKEVEARMRELKCMVIMGGEKLHFKNERKKSVGRLFKRLGYRADARYYSKLIG